MDFIKRYFGDLFLTARFYGGLLVCIFLFVASFYIYWFDVIASVVFFAFIILCMADYVFLFFTDRVPFARRISAGRLSNGDENKIELIIKNEFSFPVHVNVNDELPEQFQERKWKRQLDLKEKQQKKIQYYLRPHQRGEYHFGNIHLFVTSPLGFVSHRFTSQAAETINVYPAFMQLYKYELLSNAIIQNEGGSRRMRKIGQSMEFEQIKEYVTGDDIRTLNWKASARKGGLMVNNFMDERSQQVYCVIDKGRLMKMPFEGLTLLDYAINSCLVLSNICLKKQDRVGVITFSNTIGNILAADRKPVQKKNILQLLYNQTTGFLESDFEMLYMQIRNRIKNRSLLILFTNFESLSGLNRQIEYLRSLASHHLLLVVFFENTELNKLTGSHATNVEDVYIKTIAEKFAFEKRLIAKELMKFGILSLLSSPQKLTVNTINKYLELKTRQAI
ncbi:DUF58 domain-containing protein [Ginsengibacter hankyongi]|uniref:DUF58 domain-containing protein n=1 Tax=Ginsengibacter hankyongi TaxID=2607284 RepID=A0A5J5IN03_9BACT|nr:DUF58 domain-containing protein [Ginsengibacter hankyongi]KAA9041294.1 DUF58 domain-containing protein [Ginsengibacter hankyongi]